MGITISMNSQQNSRFNYIFQAKISEASNGLKPKYDDDPNRIKERYLNTFTPDIDSFYCYFQTSLDLEK